MRVPLGWLAEYVDLPSDATPDSVMAELVKVGLEEEDSHGFGISGPLVVGEVLEFTAEPQSNGKTIRWCQVRVAATGVKAADGGADVRGIVCGASNFEVGDKVVVCLPGSTLPGDFKIAARSTYGHTSDGMLASGRELGLSDDHAGILLLKNLGLDPKVGTDAIELLHLGETAAEINVTPDRGYCLSIRGVAREYSHATGAEFRDPTGNANPELFEGYPLKIDDQAPLRGKPGVSRFVLREVSGVDVSRPTPAWMMARLKMAGMRSISLVVDITNYVMLELGQPLHAYDLDTLKGGITVRRAKPSETIKTLDGQTRKLHAEDLLITDDAGPIGIAGVMGGERTEVTSATKNVLIEAANFDPVTIARSARRHKLPSEASKRFERGVDHSVAKFAVARAVQLLEVHALGTGQPRGSDYRNYESVPPIWLPANYAQWLTGVEYGYDKQAELLREVGCMVATVADGFEVTTPTWRPDLKHKADLVEEIARIAGYDLIPARLPVAPPGRGLTQDQQGRRLVANALAAAGLTEVLNYPFVGNEANHWFEAEEQPAVVLSNPIQSEAAQLRLGLLPNLLDAAKRNVGRGLTDLALFEVGSVFRPADGKAPKASMPSVTSRPSEAEINSLLATLPAQPKHVAAVFLGQSIPQQVGQSSKSAGYQDAVQAVRLLAHSLGLTIDLEQAEPKGYHPGRAAQVFAVSGQTRSLVGLVGELDPSLAEAIDLPRRVGVFELNLDSLLAARPSTLKAKDLWVMTAATQMLSLDVPAAVPAEAVRRTILSGAGELLEAADLVDDYRGENLPAGTKSLTFSLRFRAEDRTLTQTEASEARDAAVALAAKEHGASIRK
ncbi:MAG: hypothetical protein RL670_266 [Actinomycetota bacterium]